MGIHLLNRKIWFPDPESANEYGIVAAGGDLSAARLELAYRSGIFPWYSQGEPILWWSPDPRFVLFPDSFRLTRSLAKIIRQKRFEIRFDTVFAEVIKHCSSVPRPHQDGTWITAEMVSAYIRLHRSGLAHSIEIFSRKQLVGGLYGIAMGSFFFGESMFHLESNASKVALAVLVDRFRDAPFIDCQVENSFFLAMGATHIPRAVYLETLREHIGAPTLWDRPYP